MNVYDFDETIFWGDSEDRFFEYIFERRKDLWLFKLMHPFWEKFFKCRHIEDKKLIRQIQYGFLPRLENIDEILEDYWDKNVCHMKAWYETVRRPDDIIATGTPRFLMEPLVRRVGINNLVATEMDKHTGKVSGVFAVGRYKLQQVENYINTDEIDNFHSDAWSDRFLASKAKKAYAVHSGEQRTEWSVHFADKIKKCKNYPEM